MGKKVVGFHDPFSLKPVDQSGCKPSKYWETKHRFLHRNTFSLVYCKGLINDLLYITLARSLPYKGLPLLCFVKRS